MWIRYLDRKGKLTVGYGAKDDRIGPELGFGTGTRERSSVPSKLRRFWFAVGVSLLALCRPPAVAVADDAPPQKAEMAGYLLVPHGKVDAKYHAGFSMYVAAWSLLKNYPGQEFQSGLFGTWMFAQLDGPKPEKMYSDIEGGLVPRFARRARFPSVATGTSPVASQAATIHRPNARANAPGASLANTRSKVSGLGMPLPSPRNRRKKSSSVRP